MQHKTDFITPIDTFQQSDKPCLPIHNKYCFDKSCWGGVKAC